LSLIRILEENANFNFTGIINILDQKTRQFLGSVSMSDGKIAGGKWKELMGMSALIEIAYNDQISDNLKFVNEPEVIHVADIAKLIGVQDFKKMASEAYQKILSSQKLAPPKGLRLIVDAEFIINGEDPSALEFKVLKQITDDPKVETLYEHIKAPKHQVDMALIRLRKNRAIKVLSNK